jgi:hypothetical protein
MKIRFFKYFKAYFCKKVLRFLLPPVYNTGIRGPAALHGGCSQNMGQIPPIARRYLLFHYPYDQGDNGDQHHRVREKRIECYDHRPHPLSRKIGDANGGKQIRQAAGPLMPASCGRGCFGCQASGGKSRQSPILYYYRTQCARCPVFYKKIRLCKFFGKVASHSDCLRQPSGCKEDSHVENEVFGETHNPCGLDRAFDGRLIRLRFWGKRPGRRRDSELSGDAQRIEI